MFKAIAFGVALVATVTAAVPTAPQHIVSLKSSRFVPASLVIHSGDTVLFKNLDSMYHTVTANDLRFDSGAIPSQGTWSHRFTKTGRYAIFCAYHPKMVGTIVVVKAKHDLR